MNADKAHQRHVSVAQFLEIGRDRLAMELVGGKAGLKRQIPEAAINRPGLALSGFFEHFAPRRIQVVGLSEHAYLNSLAEEERTRRLRDFFASKIPCLVITRHKRVFPEIHDLAEEFRVPVLRTKQVTKHFVNAATILMENLMAPVVRVQGTMVEIMGIGVLIEGKPGLGKSETALGLVKRGGALVSDDITVLRLDSQGVVMGSPVTVTRYHMEIRGLGIIHVPSLFGVASVREEKRLDLVVTLVKQNTREDIDRDGQNKMARKLLGVDIPQVVIEVAPGRDLVNIVETAALDQKLIRLGHDAAKELDTRLVALLSGGPHGSE